MRVIKIGDKDYRIHYGQNAICELEDELDESIITSGELVKLLLAEHNLLIKDLRGKTSRNYIRLAIRKPDENNILLEKLRMILG